MYLAKVIGTVVSTQKNSKCQGMKLLLIQPYVLQGEQLTQSGSSVVAVDTVCAGYNELVLFTQGSSARLTDFTRDTPVDTVIVGVVDTVEAGGKLIPPPQ